MNLKVYSIGGAPSPWRVLVALAFKALDYDLVPVSFSDGGLKSRSFLKLNSRATVPVLVCGEIILRDSIAILGWLDRQHPDRPLFGVNPVQAARIWQMTTELAQYLRAANRSLLTPIFFGGANQATEELRQAAETCCQELTLLETMLENSPYLAGREPSAADAVAFPEIRLIQRAIDTKPSLMAELGMDDLSEFFPSVAVWMARIESFPGVEKSMPKHWSTT